MNHIFFVLLSMLNVSLVLCVFAPFLCLNNNPVFLFLIIMDNCQNTTFLNGVKTPYTIYFKLVALLTEWPDP